MFLKLRVFAICLCYQLVSGHDDPLAHAQQHVDSAGGGEHDFTYDHEIFLGKDTAAEFETLTDAQSQERLKLMLPMIDFDKNGTITKEELKEHIKRIQNKFLEKDTDRNWSYHPKNEQNLLSWKAYQKSTYGSVEDEPRYEEPYMEMYLKDKLRFPTADVNNDGFLSREEFRCFIHPESCDHMKDLVVKSSFDAMDRNKDSKIDEFEYFYDVFKTEEVLKERDANSNEEPGWLVYERGVFRNYRDKNGDGTLDFAEVRQWIMPVDYDGADVEAQHLIHNADSDKDNKLSYDEIMQNWRAFVGSQATNYGQALKKDEL